MPLESSGPETERGGPRAADALLARAGTGDTAAFGDFYDLAASRVFGTIRRLLIDQAQSEEVTQEVFLEIWQTASRFEPNRGGALSWATTIARRRAVDRIRSAQADRERDVRVGLRDRGPEFDEVSETAEIHVERERVRAAMVSLSDPQREVMDLAYFVGCTHREIAGRLQIPIGTVKTRLHDGMRRLRRELGVEVEP